MKAGQYKIDSTNLIKILQFPGALRINRLNLKHFTFFYQDQEMIVLPKPEKPIKFPWTMKTSLFIVMKISLKIWSTFFIMKAMAKSGPYFACPKKSRKSNWSWNYCLKEVTVVVQVSKFQKIFFLVFKYSKGTTIFLHTSALASKKWSNQKINAL